MPTLQKQVLVFTHSLRSIQQQENAAATEETNAAAQEVLAMIQEIAQGTVVIKELSEDLQGRVSLYQL